jgi:NAD(P)H-dependent FMN reductase
MDTPRIGIIIGSTRQGRFGDKPGRWIHEIAKGRQDMEAELIDLRDWPLPFFDEPRPLSMGTPQNELAQRWGRLIAGLDGFVVVTPEYNRGPSAVLKNAFDYAYKEWHRKAIAFVGYGSLGAARSVEALRTTAIELQLAPIRSAIHIGRAEFRPMLMEGKTFADFPHLDEAAKSMLDELAWWTRALKAAREAG